MTFNSILNIGRQGLYASQAGLSVTSQNISNINTPGYTRQRLAQAPISIGGVQVLGTERLNNTFFAKRLTGTNSELGSSQTQLTNLQQVESILGSKAGSGLSASIAAFFDALQNLSTNPGGTNERNLLSQNAQAMLGDFAGTSSQLSTLRSQLDAEVASQVERVNQLTEQLARINEQMQGLSNDGLESRSNPGINALRDSRDAVINELSTYLNVTAVEGDNSSFLLYAGGQLLVEGKNRFELKLVSNPSNDGLSDVVINAPGQPRLVNSAQFPGGTLGGLLESRDVHAREALTSVDRLATSLLLSFNAAHGQGAGLIDGTSRAFFTGLQATAASATTNSGTLSITSTGIVNPSQVTLDDYEIRFTSATSYEVVNKTTGATVTSAQPYTSGGAISFAGMQITLSGGAAAGDRFTLNAYSGGAATMGLNSDILNNASHIAAGLAANPGQPSAAGDNRNVLDLIALRERLGTQGKTFEGYLDAARLKVATSSERLASKAEQDAISQSQAQGMLDAASAVSLDEEAISILQYQRAFEASSRVISSADELMQTLLQMI